MYQPPKAPVYECPDPRRNTCKHYRKTIRRCARRWAFGRDPTVPCDGWCQK